MTILHIRQRPLDNGKYPITLTLKRPGQADLEGEAKIEFALTPAEQEDLRWYMEDYLTQAQSVQAVQIAQIEAWMKQRGEELYGKVLAANMETQAIWFAVREQLADLRVEIAAGKPPRPGPLPGHRPDRPGPHPQQFRWPLPQNRPDRALPGALRARCADLRANRRPLRSGPYPLQHSHHVP